MGLHSSEYFYYEINRKLVTVFGAMFNDIHTARRLSNGTLENVQRVPLSYGPRSKFLARILENTDGECSIKLPRMAFEITDISFDEANKLKKTNRVNICENGTPIGRAYAGVPYNVTFELSIFGRSQDDMFQILEQILPSFSPDYTITIKNIEGTGNSMDVPFTLTSVGLSDEYEGDFQPARPLIYTLQFNAKVKYLGNIDDAQGIIEHVTVEFRDKDNLGTYEKIAVNGAGVETIEEAQCFISQIDSNDLYEIVLDSESALDISEGENVIGDTTSYAALVQNVDGATIQVNFVDDLFQIGENLIAKSGTSYEILSINALS